MLQCNSITVILYLYIIFCIYNIIIYCKYSPQLYTRTHTVISRLCLWTLLVAFSPGDDDVTGPDLSADARAHPTVHRCLVRARVNDIMAASQCTEASGGEWDSETGRKRVRQALFILQGLFYSIILYSNTARESLRGGACGIIFQRTRGLMREKEIHVNNQMWNTCMQPTRARAHARAQTPARAMRPALHVHPELYIWKPVFCVEIEAGFIK